jgi:hypothetical protein
MFSLPSRLRRVVDAPWFRIFPLNKPAPSQSC